MGSFLNKVTCGDCLELMRELPDNSIDSVITDPPYEIGFMGKSWDNTGIAFNVEVWAECLRVAKPGAFLLAFGGTRTWHRIACAIEDAGWTLRDTIAWHYGSGFPKSLDISKSLDKQAGAEREVVETIPDRWAGKGAVYCRALQNEHDTVNITAPSTELAKTFDGYGTALKPSFEPIMVFMKPCDGTFAQNAEKWNIAGLDIDGGRIGTDVVGWGGASGFNNHWGMASGEPRPTHGRWPANTILSCACEGEHAEDCPVRIMDEQSNGASRFFYQVKKDTIDEEIPSRFLYTAKPSRSEKEAGLEGFEALSAPNPNYGSGGFSRPTGQPERETSKSKNSHPTCKPLSLMKYLCKLTRPPHGGIVLDPFTGSGTTGIAAILEDRDFIGFELSQEYCDIANARIEHHHNNEQKVLFAGG